MGYMKPILNLQKEQQWTNNKKGKYTHIYTANF